MKKGINFLLIITMLASFVLTSCSSGGGSSSGDGTAASSGELSSQGQELTDNPAADGGNVLRYISLTPPGIFNPILFTATYDQYICDMIFDKLLDFDNKTMDIVPSLAESWDEDAENNAVVFHIKKGVKIQNGLGELTAEDVAFTLSMIMDPKYDGTFFDSFENITGAQDYKTGKAEIIKGITLYGEKPSDPLPVTYDSSQNDPYQIKISYSTLTTSDMDAAASLYILPRTYYDKDSYEEFSALSSKPVGTGPMIFQKYVTDQYIELAKNPDYWNGVPKIDKVVYTCVSDDTKVATMQSGEADVCEVRNTDEDLNQINTIPFLTVDSIQGSTYAFVRFNMNNPILQDVKVRQALAYGFDRASFVKAYTGGRSTLTFAPVPRDSDAYPKSGIDEYAYDPQKAGQLLDEAGWKLGNDNYRYKDGKKLSLVYTGVANNANDSMKTAAMIENYKSIGIDLSTKFYDWASYLNTVKTDENVQLYGYATNMYPDIYKCGLLLKGGALVNDGHYNNPDYDKLLETARVESDADKASEMYQQAFQLINKDCPIIFMNDYTTPWVINKRVKNFVSNTFVPWTSNIENMEIVQP